MKRKKFLVAGLAVLGVAFAMPAAATQKGVNACTKSISDNSIKTTKSVAAVFTKCAKAVEGCLAKDVGDQAGCLAGLVVADKACADNTLDLTNADGKAGKPLAKALVSIDKKCNPVTLDDPEKLTLGTGATINDPNNTTNTLLDTSTAALAQHVGGQLFVNPVAPTYNAFQTAIRSLIIRNIFVVVQDKHPRVWWLLRLAGISFTRLANLGLGTHHVVAATTATLGYYGGGVPLAGIVGNYDLEIGAVDPVTQIAPVTIPAASATFTSVFVPVAGNITVCVNTPTDGAGQLCCGTCGTMGPISYAVNQDHESSGNNTAFGLAPGAVGPADPNCTRSVTNSIGGGTDVTVACLESHARSGGCNAQALGDANPNSRAPRCLGGSRNGRFCNLGLAATDCPGGGGCPGATSCCSQSPAVGPIAAPPCNGPTTVVTPVGTGLNGDMVLGTSIQFTLHSHTNDSINYQGTCPVGANCAGDGVPDGFGADGVGCTDDDTTTPGDPANLAQTMGTTSATVFNANLVPTGFGGTVATGAYVGAKPTNACHRLSASVTSGYTMVATFPALNNSSLGDTATGVRQVW